MIKLPIALGLYSVRATLFTDMPGTLKKVKEMGYDGIEFYGPFSYLPSAVLKALKENDLKICGWHVMLDALEGVNFDATVAYMKAIGVENLVVPYLDGNSAEEWKALGIRMGAAAEKLQAQGINLGYHNHAHEFTKVYDGKTAWDILFENMPECVFPQIDTGNGMQGGMDLNNELNKYQGRLQTLHFKPFKAGAASDGHDIMFDVDDHDLKSEISMCEAGGLTWLVIEFETENTYSQMGGAREALRTFKQKYDC